MIGVGIESKDTYQGGTWQDHRTYKVVLASEALSVHAPSYRAEDKQNGQRPMQHVDFCRLVSWRPYL